MLLASSCCSCYGGSNVAHQGHAQPVLPTVLQHRTYQSLVIGHSTACFCKHFSVSTLCAINNRACPATTPSQRCIERNRCNHQLLNNQFNHQVLMPHNSQEPPTIAVHSTKYICIICNRLSHSTNAE